MYDYTLPAENRPGDRGLTVPDDERHALEGRPIASAQLASDDDLIAKRPLGAVGSPGWHHPAIFGLRQMRPPHQPAGFIWMSCVPTRRRQLEKPAEQAATVQAGRVNAGSRGRAHDDERPAAWRRAGTGQPILNVGVRCHPGCVEVTAEHVARVPGENLRVDRADFGALWALAEHLCDQPGPDDDYLVGVVLTCRWLAGRCGLRS